MRATEFLIERTLDDGSQLMAAVGDWWIWQVPQGTYLQFYQKNKGRAWNRMVPATASEPIFFVSHQQDWQGQELLPTSSDPSSYAYRFVSTSGGDLRTLAGDAKLSAAVLRKLAALTGAKNAPDIGTQNKSVLYQGKIQSLPQMREHFTKAPLSDGTTVMMVPKDLWWTVGWSWHTDNDNIYQLINPLAREITLYTKDGKITDAYYVQERAGPAVSAIRELANREGLTIATELKEPPAKKKKKPMIKPGSIMHKMLRYVAQNPGCSRSDWFVKHLGLDPQGMQAFNSDKSPDGKAAALGWLENKGTPSKYKLELTMMGHMILGMLDAGNPVPQDN